MKFLYCHGFASGPGSRKAGVFREYLADAGLELLVPALDGGDFAHLTISGQLEIMERTLARDSACLIGSSMGGYLAALYAAAHPEVEKLVLMAPAFDFAPRWKARLTRGAPIEVFHYGEKRPTTVHYELIEDALKYTPIPHFSQPALIFHGLNDDVVPIGISRAFADQHANVKLTEMESDHELLNVLDQIASEAVRFLRPA